MGQGGGGGTGGAGEDEPGACPGDPVADPSLVRGGCGIFVSASAAPGGDGTKAAPFQSFAQAVAKLQDAEAQRIYACAEVFTEKVELSGGIRIHGGLDCANG
ncbi:Hypothetical protein CAP_7419 [Chondromyces apiculatus DSM 436]|uniref:Uncharacterized protein n=1 Tax=Chondromyces apiculatus DSM 436 TaxID=1192034 RepID=A0A017SYP0_9BACT|nr:Hypothetical protein CAP_7419 [Chondromyces apiculatus DSM 436]